MSKDYRSCEDENFDGNNVNDSQISPKLTQIEEKANFEPVER
jgi:hypothetical protein